MFVRDALIIYLKIFHDHHKKADLWYEAIISAFFLLLPSPLWFSIDISVWLGPGSIDVGLIAGRRGLPAMGA